MIDIRFILSRSSLLSTMYLIDEFLNWKREKGYGSRCFSYKGLRNYMFYRSNRKMEWHTVERAIRELASSGVLRRTKKPGVFCVTQHFNYILWEIKALWRGGRNDI